MSIIIHLKCLISSVSVWETHKVSVKYLYRIYNNQLWTHSLKLQHDDEIFYSVANVISMVASLLTVKMNTKYTTKFLINYCLWYKFDFNVPISHSLSIIMWFIILPKMIHHSFNGISFPSLKFVEHKIVFLLQLTHTNTTLRSKIGDIS